MVRVRILDEAARELARLDKPAAQRVVERIHWLAENLDSVTPAALAGNLSAFRKLRAGDYRVLYEILYDEETIVIHAIGHRRDIYRKR